MTTPQVHDLVRIDPATAARWNDAPSWVRASLERAPWVVVRRGPATTTDVPIGVRGATRAERFGTNLRSADIRERLTPLQLRARIPPVPPAEASIDGAARVLHAANAVAAAASRLGIRWGPTGAYGFELAAGIRATHLTSDLDMIVLGVLPPPTLRAFARCCERIAGATGVRIDAEVLVDGVGIALAEAVSGAPLVLAKTPTGPRLIAAPA